MADRGGSSEAFTCDADGNRLSATTTIPGTPPTVSVIAPTALGVGVGARAYVRLIAVYAAVFIRGAVAAALAA